MSGPLKYDYKKLKGDPADAPGLSSYIVGLALPIAGGTMAGNLDMDHYQISNVQAIDSDEITLNGLPVASEQYASNASNLTLGTVSDNRLSANVPLKNAANTFSAAQTFAAGSMAAPSINVGDSASGIYRVSANQIGFVSNGSELFRIATGSIVYCFANTFQAYGNILPASHNVSDLGSSGVRFRTGYFGTGVTAAGQSNFATINAADITATGTTGLTLTNGSSGAVVYSNSGGLLLDATMGSGKTIRLGAGTFYAILGSTGLTTSVPIVANARLTTEVAFIANGFVGATANLIEAKVNSGSAVFSVGPTGLTTITPPSGSGGTLTLGGFGSTSNNIESTGFLQIKGATASGVILAAGSTEHLRATNTYGPVFKGYIGLGVTADAGPDVYFYRNGTAAAAILANNGTALRNQANNADTPLSCSNVNASGVTKFAGYPTSLLPAAASNAGSITYDTTLSKHVGCNGSSWNALW